MAETEPLAPQGELWDLENVFITPHIANASDRLWERQMAILHENLERWFSGREPFNRGDKKRGY